MASAFPHVGDKVFISRTLADCHKDRAVGPRLDVVIKVGEDTRGPYFQAKANGRWHRPWSNDWSTYESGFYADETDIDEFNAGGKAAYERGVLNPRRA